MVQGPDPVPVIPACLLRHREQETIVIPRTSLVVYLSTVVIVYYLRHESPSPLATSGPTLESTLQGILFGERLPLLTGPSLTSDSRKTPVSATVENPKFRHHDSTPLLHVSLS